MAPKIRPHIVTFKNDADAEQAMRHMTTISKTSVPTDMTQMVGHTWSLLAPGLRFATIGRDIFVRLYCGTMKVFCVQVDDLEDAQGLSIKDMLN